MPTKLPKPKPFVSVIWRDAEDGPTWASEREAVEFAEQDCLVDSRGWLVRKTKKFIILAADKSISGNNPGELGRICKVPRSMVLSITELPNVLTPPQPAPPSPTGGDSQTGSTS